MISALLCRPGRAAAAAGAESAPSLRWCLLLPLALAALAAASGAARADTCQRIRAVGVPLQGLYDFCNEYRRLQADVAQMKRQVEQLERERQTLSQVRRQVAARVPVSEVLTGAADAAHKFSLAQPAVLLATANVGAGRVAIRLDGEACAAAGGTATCMRPLEPGDHRVEASGSDVVLSVVAIER